MKAENRKFLKEYEQQLQTAYRANYCRNVPTSVFEKMGVIFREETGSNRTFASNCGECLLSLMKLLGKMYFEDDKEVTTKEDVTPDNEIQNTDTQKDTKKKDDKRPAKAKGAVHNKQTKKRL